MSGRSRAGERAGRLLLAAILAWLAVNLWAAWPFTTDDAYITLRYSRHLAAGEGPTWNPGAPPVEGYSNFSSMLLGAAAIAAGLDPALLLKSIGVASALTAAWLLWRLARLWLPPTPACFAPLAWTSLAGVPWWSVSGLETALYAATSLGAVHLFFRAWERRRAGALAVAGLAASLPALTRPEGVLVAACLGLYALLALRRERAAAAGEAHTPGPQVERPGSLRPLAVWGAAFAAPVAAHQAWRLAYYGRLLPNSAYCKIDPATDSTLLLQYLEVGWPLVLLSAVALWRSRPFDLRFLPLALIGVLYALLVRDVAAAIAYRHRHVLMALAAWSVPAAVGLEILLRRLEGSLPAFARGIRSRLAAALLAAVALVAWQGTVPGTIRARAERMADRNRTREAIAGWLAERSGPRELVATPDAGLVPFRLPNPVLDTMCLNCAAATQPPLQGRPDLYAAYVLAASPRFVVAYVGASGRFRSGLVLEIAHRTPEFERRYRRARMFRTSAEDFHFAVYERRPANGERQPL